MFVLIKDTSGMLLLHRHLTGVDGFTDAAQLCAEKSRGIDHTFFRDFASPPTKPSVVVLKIEAIRIHKSQN